MFYKVWSGTAKYIKKVLFQQRRPIEVPHFAIFAPVIQGKQGMGRTASEIDCLISNGGGKGKHNNNEVQVKLILHNDFLNKCGDNLHIPSSSQSETIDSKNVVVVSKNSEGEDGETGESAQSLFEVLTEQFGLRGLQHLSYNAIAKAC
jgi:hypothetical protein